MTKLTLVKATLMTGRLFLCVCTLWGCRLVNVPKPGEVQSLSIEDVQPKVPQPGENVVISYTLSNTAGPDEAGNVVGFVGLHGIPKPLRQADGKVAQSEPFILRRGTTKTGELLFQAPAFADTNYEVSLGFLKTVTTRFSELATNYLNAEAFWKESKPRMLDIENGPESVGILAPFDLFRVFWDDNGIALNPKWGEQMNHPGSFPNPFLCGDGYPWTRPCTTQVTWKDENNWNLCRFGDGPINGHANWAPATFEGAIFWAGHSCGACDDDYNFN